MTDPSVPAGSAVPVKTPAYGGHPMTNPSGLASGKAASILPSRPPVQPGSFRWGDLLRTPLAWTALVLATFITSVVCLVEGALFGRLRLSYWVHHRFWAPCVLGAAGVTVRAQGLENIAPGASYVMVVNHQSFFDIPCAIGGTGHYGLFVAKKEMTKIPIFGAALKRGGAIVIDRASPEKAVATLRGERERLLRDQLSVVVFPEGTRSPTGALQPFKKGAIHLALDLGLPLLPVVMDGTRDVMDPGSGIIRAATVDLWVLPPIDPAAWGVERRDELVAELRQRMSAALDALRQTTGRPVIPARTVPGAVAATAEETPTASDSPNGPDGATDPAAASAATTSEALSPPPPA